MATNSYYDPRTDPLSRVRNKPLAQSPKPPLPKSYTIPYGTPGSLYDPRPRDKYGRLLRDTGGATGGTTGSTTKKTTVGGSSGYSSNIGSATPTFTNTYGGTTSNQNQSSSSTQTSTTPQVTSRRTYTEIVPPTGELPTLDIPLPEYPEEDPEEYKQLVRSESAPGLREMRAASRQGFAQAQLAENPAVRAMLMRQVLEGRGGGIESILAGARRSATAIQQQRISQRYREVEERQRALEQKLMANFQADVEDYMRGYTTRTTTDIDYGTGTSTSTNVSDVTSTGDTTSDTTTTRGIEEGTETTTGTANVSLSLN